MGHLSTHVLDTAHGCPAAGMQVTLQRAQADGSFATVRTLALNADGRADGGPLLDATSMQAGRWRTCRISRYARCRPSTGTP